VTEGLQKPLEPRRYPRRAFEVRVGVLRLGQYQICTTKDIGEGGLALGSEQDLGKGQRILMSFQIPSGQGHKGEFISIIGTTLSVRKVGGEFFHGIAFDQLDFNYKRQIRAYVASKKFQ
jgi:hypothetical protein